MNNLCLYFINKSEIIGHNIYLKEKIYPEFVYLSCMANSFY